MSREREEGNKVGVCSECANVQNDQYVENNAHYKSGAPMSCQWCGGLVMIVHQDQIERAIAQSNRRRGIQ